MQILCAQFNSKQIKFDDEPPEVELASFKKKRALRNKTGEKSPIVRKKKLQHQDWSTNGANEFMRKNNSGNCFCHELSDIVNLH